MTAGSFAYILGPIELVILGLFLKIYFFYRLDWNLISCTNEHLLFKATPYQHYSLDWNLISRINEPLLFRLHFYSGLSFRMCSLLHMDQLKQITLLTKFKAVLVQHD